MPCTVVITQPTYIPWLGYFEQMAQADKFIFLDTVQFEKQSWQCRNRLKTHSNEPFWLSVPLAPHPLQTPINKVQISPDRPSWRRKHLASIRASLGGAPYFKAVFPTIQTWLETEHAGLCELNISGILAIASLLQLEPTILRASELQPEGSRTELVVNLCRQANATRYYSAAGSKVYLDEPLFAEHNIELTYQTWPHPVYPQQREPFVSHLSIVDALMNIGPEATRRLLYSAPIKI